MIDPVENQVRWLVDDMKSAIESFRSGKLPLDRLTSELKSRVSEVEKRDPTIGPELRNAWTGIEYVNAIFINSGRANLNDEEKTMLQSALQEFVSALPNR